ncbi:hypothetical protein [Actinoplanes sp. NPDC089786]|uniref:hypothetical protein n=1 Tax=Actinoplanes sp. NPDC089786 TaxID=3155185 RepID=UPI003412BFB8
MVETNLRRIRVLDALYDFTLDATGTMPSVLDVIELDELTPESEPVWRDLFRDLDRAGLIKLAESMGFEGTSMVITHAGRVDVESRRARRNDPIRRNVAARDAVIRWLHGRPNHEAPDVHPISQNPAFLFEGLPISTEDLDAAVGYLESVGLITGFKVWGGVIARPRLTTPQGIDCAEQFGGSVSNYLRHQAGNNGAQNTVTFNGPVSGNVAWDSQHVTQTASTNSGLAADELKNMLRAIQDALPVLNLPSVQENEVRANLESIDGELASSTPDASKVKTFMSRALTGLGAAANSSLATVLTASATELMSNMGLPLG